MAKILISPISPLKTSKISDLSVKTDKILNLNISSKIDNINNYSKIENMSSDSKIINFSRKEKIIDTLPFRVKFINIGIVSVYGPNNAAPIGIAVIGLNNYVM